MEWSLREPAEGGPSMEIVTRQRWGAMEPRKEDPPVGKIEVPMDTVCFTYTDTDPCSTQEECIKLVKNIQTEQMDIVGLPDITFSFLVGGDGAIYEGRGWYVEPHRPQLYWYLEGKGIEIAYIGDYDELPPPPEMIRSAFDFVLYGIKIKMIKHNFQSIHLA